MKPFYNTNIKIRLILGFGVLITFILIQGATSYYEVKNLGVLTDNMYNHPFRITNAVNELQFHLNGMQGDMKDIANAHNDSALQLSTELMIKHEVEIFKLFKVIEDQYLGDPDDVTTVIENFKASKPPRDSIISLSRAGKYKEAYAITTGQGANRINLLVSQIQVLEDFANKKAIEFYKDSKKAESNATFILVSLGLLIIFVSVLISITVIRSIKKSISTGEKYRQEVEKKEKKLSEAQRIAHLGSWDLDLISNKLTWSDEVYRIFELDKISTDSSYEAFLDAIHPDDREFVSTSFSDAVSNHTPYNIEHRLLMTDGRIKWVQERCQTNYDDHGEPLTSFGTILDITEQKNAEKSLYESELRFTTIYENAPVLINAFDKEGHCLFWNKHCTKTFGWTFDEINAHGNAMELFYPDPAKLKEALNNIASDQEGEFRESEPLTKDGEKLITMWANFNLPDGMTFSLGYDITQEKQAEQALKESAKFSKEIIESMSDGFSMLDVGGVHLDVNLAFCEMTGFSKEELIGIGTPHPYWPEEEYANIQEAFVKTSQGNFTSFELVFKRKNGTRFPVLVSPSQITDEKGNVVNNYATIKNITEIQKSREILEELVSARTADLQLRTAQLQKANEELLHAESEMHRAYDKEKEVGELKSRFVSTASHQFRTPLTVIQSNVELMEMNLDKLEGSLRARFEKSFERINKESYRMTSLMDDVLILGKINADAVVIHPEWIDVNTLTRDMIQRLNEIDTPSPKIHFEMSGEPKKIFVDQNQFTHILLNVLSNAQKYTVDQSDIALQLAFDSKQLQITIEDHGIGMSQEDLKTVFQPFTRGRNTEGIQGTGLGMSIVQEYVSLNNGKIKFDSELNVGTTVTLTFTDQE